MNFLAIQTTNIILPFERISFADLTTNVKTRTGSAIESGRDCGSATGNEFVNEIAKGTGTIEDPAAVTETGDKGTTEVVAEIDHMEIGAGSVIATEIDIGIG